MIEQSQYNLTKKACYLSGITMAIAANLSPVLFVTFKNMYDVSYTMLGLLVVINFFTQLLVDLAFTFFTKYFNIHKCVRATPLLIFVGLLIYAVLPCVFPQTAFLWISIGTVVFSVASGLSEVLISPVIAAIPSDNPDREMSKLHSMYAFGTVGVVVVSTFFITVLGAHNWMYLALLWSVLPLCAFLMFLKSPLPKMDSFASSGENKNKFGTGILLCALCIFFGGAAECTMSQWASGFIEMALDVPKVVGDVFGVCAFALLLGIGRTVYAKYGKNIINVLLIGMLGAAVCYFTAGLVNNSLICIIACALTGICTSMLWPGTLIYVEEKFVNVSVAVYALMAAGGDLGASVGPQIMGYISDKVSVTNFAISLSQRLNLSAEQIGMRAGIVVCGIFPLLGVFLIVFIKRYFKKKSF